MNECFFIGKVIGDIDFRFIKQKGKAKHNSISLFKLEILDKNIIKLKAYNELADFCYSKLENNDLIFMIGKVETGEIVEIKYIKKL